MNINLFSNKPELLRTMEEVVRIFYPETKFTSNIADFTIYQDCTPLDGSQLEYSGHEETID